MDIQPDQWATPEGGPPLAFRHRPCGHQFTPTVTCDACGEPVAPADVEVLPGPGARKGPGTSVLAEVLAVRANPQQP